MYNVPVGPSKIAAKTRRGMNMDRKNSHHNKRQNDGNSVERVNAPRPVFNTSQKNKGEHSKQQEIRSPEHEEVVNFVNETWNAIWEDYQEHVRNNTTGPDTVMYYEEKTPCKALENFKPFDIEAWWGKRLFENITKNTPANNEASKIYKSRESTLCRF